MTQQDQEIESAELRASEAFFEALRKGNLQAAAQNLRNLKGLERPDVELLADLLDGKASPSLFQWRIVVQRRRRGRPARLQQHHVKHKTGQFDKFLNALSCGNTDAAAQWLRKKGKLHLAELERLADHLDDPDKKLPWRLVPRQRRRGTPADPLQSSAKTFVLSLLVDKSAFAKDSKEAAVQDVMTRTGLSRSTIQRSRQLSRRTRYD
jgi:hypothetical protein